jgi:hypothetical protein
MNSTVAYFGEEDEEELIEEEEVVASWIFIFTRVFSAVTFCFVII